MFDKSLDFWKKNSIFGKKFNFWKKIQFLEKKSIFGKKINFWKKNSIFDEKIRFLIKFCKRNKNGELIKNDAWSRKEIVGSQTRAPNVNLDGFDYLTLMPPDGLHWFLGCIRVRYFTTII